jgi:putative oxygen-independent coproporphyrinogen III oxidase
MNSKLTAALAEVDALYLHIPFCERCCEYCDFASVAGLRGHREYVDALRAQLRATARALPGITLRSIFVGGGTPGLLPPHLLKSVLDEVGSGFQLSADCEVTIEANPSSTSQSRATAWLEAGVNRVSLGVQSLDADALRFLGRVHDASRALAALDELRAAGVQRRSADLIYGIPGLSDAAWRSTVERILEYDCGHLSAYELTVEPGTPLHASVERGEVVPVVADTALRQHWAVVDLAEAAGYRQYEVSNFARPGEECRHNLVYWSNGFYLACGVGAHGHLPPAAAAALGIGGGSAESGPTAQSGLTAEWGPTAKSESAVAVRYWHHREPADYVARVTLNVTSPIAGSETVDAATAEAERIMVGLRLRGGVVLDQRAQHEATVLADGGLLEWDGTRARATRRGQELLNAVALRLVEAGAAS